MSVLHAPTYRWTVEKYEELGRAGFFQCKPRVELLNGEIVTMSPIGFRHATAVKRLTKFFNRLSGDRYDVTAQLPIIIDELSEPEPDLALVDPASEATGKHPQPAHIFLVIEVSDSTLRYDRENKLPAYARNGVREFWLLNLQTNQLEVYRDPAGESYRDTLTLRPDETIAPLAFPDVELRVGDFLP